VILSKIVYVHVPYLEGFARWIILLYSCKIVDKVQLRTVSNIGIYCSSKKVGTVYPVQYIFENFTVNSNAICNLYRVSTFVLYISLFIQLHK